MNLVNKNDSNMNLSLRHGKEPEILDMENLTFNDAAYSDGTLVKDLTFAQLVDQSWTAVTKNNSTLTPTAKSGFIGLFAAVGLAVLLVVGIAVGGYEYTKNNPKLGATVYTTQLTDTLNTFRNQVNSSTANLNAQLNSVSSTVSGFGTAALQNIPIPVLAGGTGTSTSPTNAQFFSASGTTPTWKTFTFGNGINSTTTATSVTISTQGVDVTANYAWTGLHTFTSLTSASTTLNGTTTITGNTIFSVLPVGATPFGGTGSDGALVATSTVVNISMGGAQIKVFNFSSISITGTGSVQFTSTSTNGTIAIIKSQGACTITASSTSFSVAGLGGIGGAGSNGGTGGAAGGAIIMECAGAWNFGASSTISVAGIKGNDFTGDGSASGSTAPTASSSIMLVLTTGGGLGGNSITGQGGSSTFNTNYAFSSFSSDVLKYRSVAFIGTGGGGGGGGTGGEGGGGGAGGFFLALYGSLTANSGTVSVAGGVGGASHNSPNGSAAGGGNAIASGSTGNSSNGGTGATGISLIAQRTF